jgi:hypothetical protein
VGFRRAGPRLHGPLQQRVQYLVLREHHLREPVRRAGVAGVGGVQPGRDEHRPVRARRRSRRSFPPAVPAWAPWAWPTR